MKGKMERKETISEADYYKELEELLLEVSILGEKSKSIFSQDNLK